MICDELQVNRNGRPLAQRFGLSMPCRSDDASGSIDEALTDPWTLSSLAVLDLTTLVTEPHLRENETCASATGLVRTCIDDQWRFLT